MPAIHSQSRRARAAAPVLTLLAFAALASANAQAPAAAPPAGCDRGCLTAFVDAYYAALLAHDARKFPQAAHARITENGAEKKLGDTFWAGAAATAFRFDIVNTKRGDTGTEVAIRNVDGTKTLQMLRLKVRDGAITEIESIRANKGDADRLWDADTLTTVSPAFQLSAYHRARLLPDSRRFENGLQTTGVVRDGQFQTTMSGFDNGRFIGRNIWDRRYPVVDEERGVVLSIVRFGLKGGAQSQSVATSNDRLVAEFFAVKAGYIQEIQAVLFNLPDAKSTGWPADTGPGRASAE
jgi:hypothetical protein